MILDRGFIMIESRPEYIKWIHSNSKDKIIGLEDSEPSIYLIEDDFMDDELVLKKYFDEIFIYELELSGIDESLWPEINLENFKCFFKTIMGVSVFDLKQK